MAIRQPFVIEAELMEQRRVEIVHGDGVLGHVVSVVVRRPVDDPGLHAGARHPDGERARMVIAAVVVASERALAIDRTAELRGPQHERVVEQAAAFEIADERRRRLIERLALEVQLVRQAAVLVPPAEVELDEPHAALRQAPRQKAVGGERAGLPRFVAVKRERLRRLGREVGELRRGRLHSISELGLRDPGFDLRIERARGFDRVQLRDGVEETPAIGARHAARIVEEEHGRRAAPKPAALMFARQKRAAPEPRRQRLHVAEALRDEDDEGRQVLVGGTEPVARPCAEGGPTRLLIAGLDERDGGLVIDGVRVHRPDDAELRCDLPEMRQEFAHPRAVRAVFVQRELELGRRDREPRLSARHAGQALSAADRLR